MSGLLRGRDRNGRPEARPEFSDVIEVLQEALEELPGKTSIRVSGA